MRRFLLALCLLVTLPVTAVAAPQAAQGRRGRPKPGLNPFVQLPTPRGWPAAGVGTDLDEWLAAIGSHEPGVGDNSVRLVARWTPSRLADTIAAFERRSVLSLRLTDAAAKTALAWRAIVLHTDTAVLAMKPGGTPDGVFMADTTALHFGVALHLVEWVRGRPDADQALARAWYRVAAAFMASRYEITSTPILVEWALERFPGDVGFLMLAGGIHEVLASAWVQESPDLRHADKCGSADDNLDAAEYFYREILRTEPSNAEARLRLGYVLGRRGRHEEALGELGRVAAGTLPTGLDYYLHLFVGEEHEALGDAANAREAYLRAIDLDPDMQFAYLALSRLERRQGNRAEAVHVLHTMFDDPLHARSQSDGWAYYYTAGDARRVSSLLGDFIERSGRPR